MKKTKIAFILNPVSGTRRVSRLDELIRQHLDLKKFDYTIHETFRPGDATRLAIQGVSEGFEIMAAVGGDGTINEVVAGMGSSGTILAIIPTGSGNGLAHHLGIPIDTSKALKLINDFKIRIIDTGIINDRLFVSIAGVGFDARVANQYRKIGKRGFSGYFRTVVSEYYAYNENEYEIIIDGQLFQRKAMMITVANSNQYGYDTIIAPDASLEDGILDVVIGRKFPLNEVPRVMHLIFTRKINLSPYIEIFKAKEVFLKRKKGRRVNLDGEAVKMGNEIHVRVNPGSLKVIAPVAGSFH